MQVRAVAGAPCISWTEEGWVQGQGWKKGEFANVPGRSRVARRSGPKNPNPQRGNSGAGQLAGPASSRSAHSHLGIAARSVLCTSCVWSCASWSAGHQPGDSSRP